MSAVGSHGKIILFGEHAVVYDHPALAAGIPDALRMVSLAPTSGPVRMRILPWDLECSDSSGDLLGSGLRRLKEVVPGGGRGCSVVLKSGIPPAAGLGSSAAIAVAMVRALCQVREIATSNLQVREMAHEMEKIFHGRPSGLDDTVATFGGVCLFRRSGWDRHERERKSYCMITPQTLQVPYRKQSFLVGNSGIEHSTRHMVAGISRRRKANHKKVDALFEVIDESLTEGLAAMNEGDNSRLGKAMLNNHGALRSLGVSCGELDEMVDVAMAAGASGAKLTGAGGGGSVVAEASGCEEEVIEAWRSHGYSGWRVELTEENRTL
jgi:mevalonate kinase